MSDKTRDENPILNTGAHKILAVQFLLGSALAWAFYIYEGLLAAQAALYGGGIVMFNVWMMHRRIQMAVQKTSPNKEVLVFYLAAVQRFIFTLGFLILGMGGLGLPPIPMIAGLATAQSGYFFGQTD